MRPSSAKNRTEKAHGEQESAPESVTSKSVEFQLYVTLIIHPRVQPAINNSITSYAYLGSDIGTTDTGGARNTVVYRWGLDEGTNSSRTAGS